MHRVAQILTILALAASFFLPLTGCCGGPDRDRGDEPWVGNEVSRAELETQQPQDVLRYLQEAIQPDRPGPLQTVTGSPAGSVDRADDAPATPRLNRIWYLLAAELRDQLTYALFAERFPIIRPTLATLLTGSYVSTIDLQLDERTGRPLTVDLVIQEESNERRVRFVRQLDRERFPAERVSVWRLADERVRDAIRTAIEAPADTVN